jgi:LPXTG-motif cell wall-anchored protein
VGSSATLGTSSTFVGHIIAQTSVTATTLASVNGSLTALTGAVTLDSNAITNNNCAAVVPVPVTAPAQTSRVDSVTPAACVTTGPTTVTLNGVFPTAISNITVNGAILPTTDWVQTPTSIVVTSPVQTSAAVIIQLYNGAVPLLAVQSFVCEPVGAVTPIVPVVIPSVPTITTGTIHVVIVVNNGYGGTAVPADFTLSLRHWGVDVVGSPAAGVGGVGRTYILAPGTYVVGEPDTAGYIHSFDINGQASQNIVLAAGESITVTQTNTQLPPLGTVTPTTPPVPTVNGGPLPKTASPWSNLLLFGLGAMVLGGVMFGRKRSTQK